MTGAAQRASLAAIGRDLAREAGDRRATALLRSLQGGVDEAPSELSDLAEAPDWLRAPRAAQREVARRAALLAMAPMLATSIDGAWLGSLAELCGEDVLDWAIGHADAVEGAAMPRTAPDQLDAAGFGLLRAALLPSLRPLLDWAPAGMAVMDAGAAERLVATAWERHRS